MKKILAPLALLIIFGVGVYNFRSSIPFLSAQGKAVSQSEVFEFVSLKPNQEIEMSPTSPAFLKFHSNIFEGNKMSLSISITYKDTGIAGGIMQVDDPSFTGTPEPGRIYDGKVELKPEFPVDRDTWLAATLTVSDPSYAGENSRAKIVMSIPVTIILKGTK